MANSHNRILTSHVGSLARPAPLLDMMKAKYLGGQFDAAADCGFSSQATYKTEVHPAVIWAKFRAMAEGARLASGKL